MIKNKGKLLKNIQKIIVNNLRLKTQKQQSEANQIYKNKKIQHSKTLITQCQSILFRKYCGLIQNNIVWMSSIPVTVQKHDQQIFYFKIHKKFGYIITLQELLNQIQIWKISAQNILNKQKIGKNICSDQANQVINSLILLIVLLQKHRLVIQNLLQNEVISSMSMQMSRNYKSKKRQNLQKIINSKQLQLSNYVLKMLNFILGDYFNQHFDSSKHQKKIQTLLIGTFLKQTFNFISFKNKIQKKQQIFGQFQISQVLKMYLNSFQHIINDPFEHIYIYQVCQSLINIQRKLSLYEEKNDSHYLSQRAEHIHEIQYIKDASYKKIKILIDPYIQEIDNCVQHHKSFTIYFEICLKIYTEYSRVFLLYSNLASDQKELLKLIQKTTFVLLESSCKSYKCKIVNSSQFNEYFIFLMYFNVSYLIQLDYMLHQVKQQQQQQSQNLKKHLVLKTRLIKYMIQFYSQNQFLKTLKNQQPKLNCLKLQIFNYLFAYFKSENLLQNIKNQIQQLQFFNYPVSQLLWIHQQILKIIKNNQLAQIISNKILEELISNDKNRISAKNNIWSLKNFVKLLNAQYSTNDQQKFTQINSLICDWLCDHSAQDLLSQNQDDLSGIFQILNHQVYLPFFNKIIILSLGKFKWESLNKLYFHSLNFFYIDTVSHQLKQGIKQEDLLNVQYVRRYILNEYNAMGVHRRQIQTSSYFYKILQIQTPERFYKNYFNRT